MVSVVTQFHASAAAVYWQRYSQRSVVGTGWCLCPFHSAIATVDVGIELIALFFGEDAPTFSLELCTLDVDVVVADAGRIKPVELFSFFPFLTELLDGKALIEPGGIDNDKFSSAFDDPLPASTASIFIFCRLVGVDIPADFAVGASVL